MINLPLNQPFNPPLGSVELVLRLLVCVSSDVSLDSDIVEINSKISGLEPGEISFFDGLRSAGVGRLLLKGRDGLQRLGVSVDQSSLGTSEGFFLALAHILVSARFV